MAYHRAVAFNFAIVLVVALLLSALAHPVTETAIAVRATGEVGAHFDPRELVERSIWDSVRFLFKSLYILAAARIVCSSPAAVNVVGAVGCVTIAGVGAIYTLGLAFRNGGAGAGAGADVQARAHLIDAGLATWLDHHEPHYPSVEGVSGIQRMIDDYNGTAIRVTTCTRPDVPGCQDIYYQNYVHPTRGTLIHHLKATPASARGQSKRQYEGSTPEDDGTTFYAEYYFDMGVAADEVSMGNDDTDGGLAQHWVNAIQAQSDPDPQAGYGVFCSNIVVKCDEATVGFMVAAPEEVPLSVDTIAANFEACKADIDSFFSQGCISS